MLEHEAQCPPPAAQLVTTGCKVGTTCGASAAHAANDCTTIAAHCPPQKPGAVRSHSPPAHAVSHEAPIAARSQPPLETGGNNGGGKLLAHGPVGTGSSKVSACRHATPPTNECWRNLTQNSTAPAGVGRQRCSGVKKLCTVGRTDVCKPPTRKLPSTTTASATPATSNGPLQPTRTTRCSPSPAEST